MKLRTYQAETIDAIFDYWKGGGDNPIAELATGLGKSLINAAIFKRFGENWPALRGIMLTHRKELIEQNFKALLKLWPGADAGIYSAGLGQRKHLNKYIFAGIQSVWRKPQLFAGANFVIIDECHLLSPKDATMYATFLEALKEAYPQLKVIGLTATPYRLDSGPLTGEGQLFDDICYTYNIKDGINDGWLCPLTTLGVTNHSINLESVKVRAGEFVASDLIRSACDPVQLADTVSDMVARVIPGPSLVFCCGVDHAMDVGDLLNHLGYRAEVISGETEREERARTISEFKHGKIQFLCNCDVLTTGFDAANLTNVVMLRPTLSASLYVQMIGRGTRLAPELAGPINKLETAEARKDAIARSSKPICNVLDYAGNLRRHGPVDLARSGDEKVKRDSQSPGTITCKWEDCGAVIPTLDWVDNAFVCPQCDRTAPGSDEDDDADDGGRPVNHDAVPDMQSHLLSSAAEAAGWRRVLSWEAYNWDKRRFDPSKIPTLKIDYHVEGGGTYSEWICLEHEPGSFPHNKARKWWAEHMTRGTGSDLQPDFWMPESAKAALEYFKDEGMFSTGDRPICPMYIRVESEEGSKYKKIAERSFEAKLSESVSAGALW